MAYNQNNLFNKVKRIQDDYLKYKNEDVTSKFVYETYIYPVYNISIVTFYKYMGMNVRKELSKQKEIQDLIILNNCKNNGV